MIKANIYDKKLIVENYTVSDSVKFDTVRFEFPESWSSYEKTVVFKNNDGTQLNLILDKENDLCIDENECYIPYEVLKAPCFYISIFGIFGDSIVTTTQAKVEVLQSGYAEGDKPSDPTPTEYQQLINLSAQTREIAQSVRNDADNGLFRGEKGEQGEQGIQGEKGDKGDQGDVTLEYANSTFAPVIRNNVSGEAVKVSDVSGVEHKLSVKLTSDTLTDFSGVTVSRYGKNLWNYDDSLIINGDGISEVVSQSYNCSIINSPLTFSCNVDSSDLSYSENGNLAYLGVYYSDGTASFLTIKDTATSDGKVQVVIPINEHTGLKYLVIARHFRFTSGTVKLSNIQIEVGATATEYTAYIEPQAVTSNTDGTVEGLTSISPNMTLMTDTQGIEIDLTYNADTKMYIDNKFVLLG